MSASCIHALFFTICLRIPIISLNGEQLILVNNCQEGIWPGILGSSGKSTPRDGDFHLGSGDESVIDLPDKWSGRIWGRQGCCFDGDGKGSCEKARAPARLGTVFPILFSRKDLCPECDGAGFVRQSATALRANAARKDQAQIVCPCCNGLGKLNQIDK